MTPTRLGPYILDRKLGSGGMGDVFAAVHQDTQQPAAIKVLPAHLGQQLGFRSRFEVEIETLRRLEHPNIVRILGFGEQEGTLFYVMELVDGQSLEAQAEQGKRMPWQQVVDIALQLCSALKHAHDRGIIHRDIKPANIMLLADGQVKLADFGIAQLYGVSGLTIEGGIVGTASYLSPEQADGQKTTPRSDLYSLGATLYTMLTGRPPFVGKTLPELLRLQRTATPTPPCVLAPDIPPELDAVILGLLAKSPADRIAAPMMLSRALVAVKNAADLRTQLPPTAGSHLPDHADAGPVSHAADVTRPSTSDETLVSPQNLSKPPSDAPSPAVAENKPSPDVIEQTLASQVPATPSHKKSPPPPSDEMTLASIPSNPAYANAASASSSATDDPATDAEVTPSSMFMTAQEAAELDRQRLEENVVVQPREIPLGTIAAVLTVLVLLAGLYYLTRPPTADTLFTRISQAASADDSRALLDVAGDLDRFRSLYPDDPRISQLDPISRRLEQLQTQRLRPFVQRHLDAGQQDQPLSQLRDQALLAASQNPQHAADQLGAILTLYGDPAGYEEEDQEILADIKLRREQLLTAANQAAAAHLLILRQRIAHAQELAAADLPQAKAIASAILQLYADKPWAADICTQASEILNRP